MDTRSELGPYAFYGDQSEILQIFRPAKERRSSSSLSFVLSSPWKGKGRSFNTLCLLTVLCYIPPPPPPPPPAPLKIASSFSPLMSQYQSLPSPSNIAFFFPSPSSTLPSLMGVVFSRSSHPPSPYPASACLGDLPESCVTSILTHLEPKDVCRLARLNRAFRGVG
ncbi:hypothetical protein SAY87_020986 [Trapa incisa]|uniref:F-box domain-containing protein n=1 Tax=Trapa incisa TaxID=236973 RepID=A0AAN7JRF5_9MYRT|nr:hypothetical protein SAY87_020986 [Trapa incisa]